MRMMAKTSLTPPTRQASIWQMPMAPEVMNCLNRMRFAQCSPVATRIPRGAMARAMARCPSTSSEERFIHASVNEVIVFTGGGWFFDEPRLELGQLLHPCNRFINIPDLIRVNHHAPLPTDLLSNYCAAPNVIINISADFDFEAAPTVRDALSAQISELLVGICKQRRVCHTVRMPILASSSGVILHPSQPALVV